MPQPSKYLKRRLARFQGGGNSYNRIDGRNSKSEVQSLQKFRSIQIYETQARIYLFGTSNQLLHPSSKTNSSDKHHPNHKTYRLIKLDRDDSLTSLSDIIQEDERNYTWEEVQSIISTIEAGETKGFISVTM